MICQPRPIPRIEHLHIRQQYQRFADELIHYLEANKSRFPELTAYLDSVQQVVAEVHCAVAASGISWSKIRAAGVIVPVAQ